jgi:hypothetical protein
LETVRHILMADPDSCYELPNSLTMEPGWSLAIAAAQTRHCFPHNTARGRRAAIGQLPACAPVKRLVLFGARANGIRRRDRTIVKR